MYSNNCAPWRTPPTGDRLRWLMGALCLLLAVMFLPPPGRAGWWEPVRLGDEENFKVKDFRREEDVDGDSIPDHEDLDLDNDGYLDYNDVTFDLLVEEDDASVTYDGHWGKDSFPYYSGGTARSSNFEGDTCEIRFRGEYITVLGSLGPGMGYANIYIDNTYTSSVNLYREEYELAAVVYRSPRLPLRDHTLRVEVGRRSGEESVYPVEIDAFRVVTDPPSQSSFYNDVTAQCHRISWYAYFFVDEQETVSDEDLDDLVDVFDHSIYPAVTEKFGPHPKPGIDGIEKLYILLTDIKDEYDGEDVFEYVPGYFSRMDQFVPGTYQYSNKKDLLVIDIDPTSFSSGEVKQSLTRQLHWFVHWYATSQYNPVPYYDDYWVRNGLGLLAVYLAGLGHPYHMEFFRQYPDAELVVEEERYSTEANEGAAYLFFLYLWERFGSSFLRDLTASTTTGLDAVIEQLAEYGTTYREMFSDWVLANYIDDPNNSHLGYRYADIHVVSTVEHGSAPVEQTDGVLPLSSAHYIRLTGVDRQDIMLQFTGNTLNSFVLRAVYLNDDGSTTVEDIPLNSIQQADFTLSGFGRIYRSVMLVVSNQPPYEEDGLPWGDGVYSYRVEKFGPVLTGFFNPIFPNQIILTLEARPTPTVKVYQTGLDNYEMVNVNQVSDHLFSGHYSVKKAYPGPGKIVATGTGADGREGGVRMDFVTGRVTGGQRLDVTCRNIRLEVPAETLPDGTALMLLETASPAGRGELRPLSATVDIAPVESPLKQPLSLVLPGLDRGTGGPAASGVALFRQRDEGWVYEAAAVPVSGGEYHSRLSALGRFAVMADTASPKITAAQLTYLPDGVMVTASVTDGGSGVDPHAVALEVTEAGTSAGSESMTVTDGVASALVETDEPHLIEHITIRADDMTGNRSAHILQAAPPEAKLSMITYPNPADTVIRVKCMIANATWDGHEPAVHVYDFSGDVVARVTGFAQSAPGVVSGTWNLENNDGRPVANGTYFCTVRLGTSQGEFQDSSRFAVIR